MSFARTSNDSEIVDQIEEEIRMATRDAYLYAGGTALISCFTAFTFTWAFYIGDKLGIMHRVSLISAIYSKVFHVPPFAFLNEQNTIMYYILREFLML